MSKLPQFFLCGTAAPTLPSDDDYSNGLLETMRCQHGSVPLWPLHRQRLLRSGRVTAQQLADMGSVIAEIAAECPLESAKLRLRCGLVEGRQQWDLSLLPLEATPELEQGIRLFPCQTRLEIVETANPGCKTLQRTRYNRASTELPAGVTVDGLLRDSGGRVIESLRCNLLAWRDGQWITPDLHRCGVRGVMMSWLGGHFALAERDMDLDTLCAAEEVALCNSVRGVMPVTELIGVCRWPLGPEVRRLQQLIAEELW
ncbi:4-amino-4-deoxychorismate lyase [Microbulbifer donghaiensis]|uniref:4-amino-4-deoxychorismate lyase n=1 Tax=Microbulbifer donghaiensis TaxID=494016 RepID=A0A1M4V864_9GAMM|nr:aminotransferase class IV [Microbulbifer donghaiensis]SHE65144.1 4-amino-4-deoxychorismate lyase [Microbulbifer donghaiensis]